MIKKYRKTSTILAEQFDESNELVSIICLRKTGAITRQPRKMH